MLKLRLAGVGIFAALMLFAFAVAFMLLRWYVPILGVTFLAIEAGLAFGFVGIIYLVGPFLIDWIVQMFWCHPATVSPEFADWMKRTCATLKIVEPRFGIIEDGAPNAFTYGHGAWDARLLVSRGVIDILSPEEFKAVVGHELGHIKNRDFVMMSMVQGMSLFVMLHFSQGSGARSVFRGARGAVAFVGYYATYMMSLAYSRLREYLADRNSSRVMAGGNHLSVALVKIAYGLATTKPVGAMAPAPSYVNPARSATNSLPQDSPVAFSSQSAKHPNLGTTPGGFGLGESPLGGAGLGQQLLGGMIPGFGGRIVGGLFGNALGATGVGVGGQGLSMAPNTLGVFGITGAASVRTAVGWIGQNGQPDPKNFTIAARWELDNPWAKYAELFSTHPLTLNRIKELQRTNRVYGAKDVFDLSKVERGVYAKFKRDVWVLALPVTCACAALPIHLFVSGATAHVAVSCLEMAGLGVGIILHVLATYPLYRQRRKVLQLLGELDVSHMNPVPVEMEATITGRMSPGVPWAHDFIVQDDSGFVVALFRIPFLSSIWGWLFAAQWVGRPVLLRGWYRRFGSPYVEIDSIRDAQTGGTSFTHVRTWGIGCGAFIIGLGAVIMPIVWYGLHHH